jgi:hypothetical protein
MDGFNPKSCNALEKPFYRPIEAAIRWCGLIAHEPEIVITIPPDGMPRIGDFPQWPCLHANTEKILDAIRCGEIRHGRDGATVADHDHVAPARVTVRYTDLKEWMERHYPDQKPAFLFDPARAEAVSQNGADQSRAALGRGTELHGRLVAPASGPRPARLAHPHRRVPVSTSD